MQFSFLPVLQSIRHLLWRATPRVICLRDIERDFGDIPDTVCRLLPEPPHGADLIDVQKGLATANYGGKDMSVWDIRKCFWYLEQRGRVVRFFDLDERIFVFVRLAH